MTRRRNRLSRNRHLPAQSPRRGATVQWRLGGGRTTCALGRPRAAGCPPVLRYARSRRLGGPLRRGSTVSAVGAAISSTQSELADFEPRERQGYAPAKVAIDEMLQQPRLAQGDQVTGQVVGHTPAHDDDQLGPSPRGDDVEAVEAVEKFFLGPDLVGIADPEACEHDDLLLTLKALDRIDRVVHGRGRLEREPD